MKRSLSDPLRSIRIGPEIYSALIADLAYSVVPTCMMGISLVGVATLAYVCIGHAAFAFTALFGAAGMSAKLILMRWQRSLMEDGVLGFAEASPCQQRHLVATLITAGSVAITVSLLFFNVAVEWHVLGTALLFAYCSGVVARLAICPAIAVPALIAAAAPVILACGLWDDVPHHVTAAMFAIFLAGSLETVRHVYRNAARHIAIKLEMAALARNDPLTRLLNRLGFQEAFRAVSVSRKGIAVHCFDLDGFKAVNDRHGHAAGDRVLVEVARRIRRIAPGLAIARLGGDEFAVIQGELVHDGDAALLADRLVAALRVPYDVCSAPVSIGVSLGFVVAVGDGNDFDSVVRAADLASYEIKRTGGGVSRGRIENRHHTSIVRSLIGA